MTRELADFFQKNRTIRQAEKRASPHENVAHGQEISEKYKYPHVGTEDAIATTIGQCKMGVDN
jgi:hypothetical protein